MGLADTPAESLLRTKYSQFNDLNVNSLNISTGKKRVTIKSPSKRSASNPATPRQSNVEAKLTPFEKAKRVLAAEAKEKENALAERKRKKAALIASNLGSSSLLKRPRVPRPMISRLDASANASTAPIDQPFAPPGAEDEMMEDQTHKENELQTLSTIWVGNLPPDCDEEELRLVLEKYGAVSSIEIKNQDKKQKIAESDGSYNKIKYAFVTFSDPGVAKRIVAISTEGRNPIKLRGSTHDLRINWAKETLDTALLPPPVARPMIRRAVVQAPAREGGGGGAQAALAMAAAKDHQHQSKSVVASDDGRNVVSYDDDFL